MKGGGKGEKIGERMRERFIDSNDYTNSVFSEIILRSKKEYLKHF